MSSIRGGNQPFRPSPAKKSNQIEDASEGEESVRAESSSENLGRKASTPKDGSQASFGTFAMTSSSSSNPSSLNLGSSAISSQPEPKNLASASATAAASLLYSGLSNSSINSRYSSNSSVNTTTIENNKSRTEEIKEKSSSLSGRYTSTTGAGDMSNGSSGHANGNSTTGIGYSNGNSGTYSNSSNTYRLASLDRLAQRQKLYDNGASNGNGDNLQSKRELFFKNESSPAPALVNSINSAPTIPSNHPSTLSSGTPGLGKSEISSRLEPPAIRHHSAVNNGNGNIEDNRERELKDKMKVDKPEKDKRKKELDGYVGFANLPNQVYRKAVKRGFDFTLMVVGECGLGKSTLTNSMFLADIYSPEYPGPSLRVKKTVQVETCKVLLKENGVNLTLTIVDTPGYGDSIDNSECWQPILDYIENRYEDYLNAESRVNRKTLVDNRVHCCLYFIAPSGHGLKALDIEFMKKLHDKVNIIPVLAKADTMTPEECSHFKKQVLNQIKQHQIRIYEFPDCDEEEENKTNKQMRERVPFAVVGSNTVVEVDGKKARGRKYPWGTVLVDNLEHCDFVALRNMVVRTHLQDLKDVTNNVHYENFRCRKLAGLGPDGKPVKGFDTKNPLAQMEEEKKNHDAKMKKMEMEMEQVFEMKVKERSQRITDSERDLKRRDDQMKSSLEKLQKEISEKKKQLESDKLIWEQANGMTYEELRRRSLEALSKESSKGKSKDKKSSVFSNKLHHEDSSVSIPKAVVAPFSGTVSADPNAEIKTATVKRSTSMPKARPGGLARRTSFKGHECSQS